MPWMLIPASLGVRLHPHVWAGRTGAAERVIMPVPSHQLPRPGYRSQPVRNAVLLVPPLWPCTPNPNLPAPRGLQWLLSASRRGPLHLPRRCRRRCMRRYRQQQQHWPAGRRAGRMRSPMRRPCPGPHTSPLYCRITATGSCTGSTLWLVRAPGGPPVSRAQPKPWAPALRKLAGSCRSPAPAHRIGRWTGKAVVRSRLPIRHLGPGPLLRRPCCTCCAPCCTPCCSDPATPDPMWRGLCMPPLRSLRRP